MSVICQNFVQNAWKKDLCSNCFKSFGDHNDSNHVRNPDSSVEEKMEPEDSCRNARYTPQATTIYQSRNGMTSSHTTWKSLISEKNCRNSQPFKLESGFKGKLLTINNVFEKNSKPFCDHSEQEKSSDLSDASASEDKLVNGSPLINNDNETENQQSIQSFLNETNGDIQSCNGKVLQGILKKSTLVPSPRAHTRRSSNVGFKEEEPLVIGYGGRDFSPEELDWEMSLDGEGGSTSDSLDETEEDKVISKITKQNTEFNSNNRNLLRGKGSQKPEAKSTDLVTNGKSVGNNSGLVDSVSEKNFSQNEKTDTVSKHTSKMVTSKSAAKSKTNSSKTSEAKNSNKSSTKNLNTDTKSFESNGSDTKLILNNIKNTEKDSVLQNGMGGKRVSDEIDHKKDQINTCDIGNSEKSADKVNSKKFPPNGLSKSVLCTRQNLTGFVKNNAYIARSQEDNCNLAENDKIVKGGRDLLKDTRKKTNSGRQKNKDVEKTVGIKEDKMSVNETNGDEAGCNYSLKSEANEYSEQNSLKEKNNEAIETQTQELGSEDSKNQNYQRDTSGSQKSDRGFCGKETKSHVNTKEKLSEPFPSASGDCAKNENIAPVEEGASVEDCGVASIGRNSNGGFASERAQWGEVRQRESTSSYNHPFVPESPWDGGAINQAINTSLTHGITDDGHLINNSCEPSMTSLDNGGSSGTPITAHASSFPQCKGEEIQTEVTSCTERDSSMGETAAISFGANQDVDSSLPAEMLVNETSDCVKPRASFLHGISSEYKEEPTLSPNAVYSPAGDLFVTRRSSSSSSSSSSSDENRKSQTSVSGNDLANQPYCAENAETSINSTQSFVQELENASARDDTETANSETTSESKSPAKIKPQIPTKPTKPPPPISKLLDERQYAIPLVKPEDTESVYYSVANGASTSKVPAISHYAESNIYQEVAGGATRPSLDVSKGDLDVARESKLAALAMELEQARCSNGNTKRQAPAPPKVPDPPSEEPPSSMSRTQTESPHPPHILRSDSVPFSSSSSTTSSSSQDTDVGFTASWNINSDMFSPSNPSSKSKGSFLLNQYSKCKMLALGYTEDGGKTRKKFSLKKLLKIGKESDVPITFDPNYPNPKAWKYSENFERPRAKLEIIHPMDLEKSNVTINPGFEPVRLTSSGSIGSLTSSFDSYSVRTSMSSDYGNFDPDSLRSQSSLDSKSTSSYDGGLSSDSGACSSSASTTNGQTFSRQVTQTASCSKSPTPSRSSLSSQASTITSTCSRNGLPSRPPKPPPPPRAHSLLPGNRNFKSSNGTFKYPDPALSCGTKGPDEIESLPPKPQAPKRQFRPSMKSEYANLETKNNGSAVVSDGNISYLQCQGTENMLAKDICDNMYECIRTLSLDSEENEDDVQYQDVALPKSTAPETPEELQASSTEFNSTASIEDIEVQSFDDSGTMLDVSDKSKTSGTKLDVPDNSKSSKPSESNYSVSSKHSGASNEVKIGGYHSTLSRNKHSPLTKAPSRPPPIYVKPQRVINNKCKPWRVLENSYATLSSNNREILIKLIDCGMIRRPSLLGEMKMSNLKWEDFQLDTKRPAVVYAFGDKIVYDATLSSDSSFQVTLVISIQSQSPVYNSSNQLKYPVLGHFSTNLPSNLLQEDIQENNVDTISTSVCVIHRAEVITIENFIEDLPEGNTEELDRELCFILLQLIKGLKVLQAQGIESIDASFQNLILCKTESDNLHTLVFLSDNIFEDTSNIYTSMSENSKISLCQYALMLLLQLIKVGSSEELVCSEKSGNLRKSSKIFISSINLLKEEKAVSLSQVKTLLECYIWGVQTVLQETDSCDYDSVLQRWMDIERSNFIKSLISKSQSLYLSVEEEFYSDFFVKSNVRSIKDIAEFI